MTLTPPFSGHCLCGATRWRAEALPLWQGHCHCDSCRRATGAAMASYIGLDPNSVVWQGPPPVVHQSSPGTRWHRCATCGSPLAYSADRFPNEIHLHAATLDVPAAFAPEQHYHAGDRLGWLHLADHLPYRIGPKDDLSAVLALIRDSFAYMEGRIDPPSSLNRLDLAALRNLAAQAEIWGIGGPLLGCMVLTPGADHLYLGKAAVARPARGQGIGRALVSHAETRARALGLPELRLQVRVELTETQAIWERLGFMRTGATAHDGYDRPTSYSYAKKV